MRFLIGFWARRCMDNRGRHTDFAKEMALCREYYMKVLDEPTRKKDSVIKELETDFELKKRRVRQILKQYRHSALADDAKTKLPIIADIRRALAKGAIKPRN